MTPSAGFLPRSGPPFRRARSPRRSLSIQKHQPLTTTYPSRDRIPPRRQAPHRGQAPSCWAERPTYGRREGSPSLPWEPTGPSKERRSPLWREPRFRRHTLPRRGPGHLQARPSRAHGAPRSWWPQRSNSPGCDQHTRPERRSALALANHGTRPPRRGRGTAIPKRASRDAPSFPCLPHADFDHDGPVVGQLDRQHTNRPDLEGW